MTLDLGLAGRRVVVTGGASGIGAAVVGVLRDAGARVTAIDLRGADVDADVTREEQVASAFARVSAEFGAAVDGLVCCAGISGPVGTPAAEVSATDFARVQDVNVLGAFLSVRGAAPLLRAGADPSVVLLASDSSFTSAPGMAPYCTSKGALLALGRSLAVDLRPDGVRVNCLCPSVVDTPMSRTDLELPQGFSGSPYPVQTPEQVAGLVALLLSPLTAAVNGTHLLADFGMSAASPFPA